MHLNFLLDKREEDYNLTKTNENYDKIKLTLNYEIFVVKGGRRGAKETNNRRSFTNQKTKDFRCK